MAAAGDEGDLDACGMSTSQGFQVGGRDLELGVEQGTVDIDGYEAYGHLEIVIGESGNRVIGGN